jgi:hypothetical protein
MSDEIRRVTPEDDEIEEEWLRETGEPGVRGVGACKVEEGWQVDIWAQEFFRQDLVGLELRQRVQSALEAVEGVADVAEHDNESWSVTGTPSGLALMRAAASVVDELADRMREAMRM